MWIAIVFGCFAVAMLVGPIMMMMPTPRQASLAKLRALASQKKIRVQLVPNPTGAEPDPIAAYTLTLDIAANSASLQQHWGLIRKPMSHDIHFAGVWDWQSSGCVSRINSSWLKDFLKGLPDSVVAVQQEGRQLFLLWREHWAKGETVEQALACIEQKLDCLAHKITEGSGALVAPSGN